MADWDNGWSPDMSYKTSDELFDDERKSGYAAGQQDMKERVIEFLHKEGSLRSAQSEFMLRQLARMIKEDRF